jgi:hypothetical protein
VTELSGRELLHEWERVTRSLIAAATSLPGGSELPRQLLESMQRQLGLLEQVVKRERELQRELAAQLVGPVDSLFEFLEEGGATMRKQADALKLAGRALEETATLMRRQANLFEQALAAVEQPAEAAMSMAGLDREPRRRRRRQSKAPASGSRQSKPRPK